MSEENHEYETREEAREAYESAQLYSTCSCYTSPHCSYCESGFSLSIDEFLELYAPAEKSQAALRDGLSSEERSDTKKKKNFICGSIRREFRLPVPGDIKTPLDISE